MVNDTYPANVQCMINILFDYSVVLILHFPTFTISFVPFRKLMRFMSLNKNINSYFFNIKNINYNKDLYAGVNLLIKHT